VTSVVPRMKRRGGRATSSLAAAHALLVLVFVVAAGGCSRVDTLRLAHANAGARVDWPAGAGNIRVELAPMPDGRLWIPLRVDDGPPVPFLLQASAGAIALTGARASGFGPAEVGRIKLHGELLPGIPGGLLIQQREIRIGDLRLRRQSVLLVDSEAWPHGAGGQYGAAGVLGWDLFRHFTVEIDRDGQWLALHRPGAFDVTEMAEVQRLAILDRKPHFEALLDIGHGVGRWVRLVFEPGYPGTVCLGEPQSGRLLVAGRRIAIEDAPCAVLAEPYPDPGSVGIFGAGALAGLVVGVDYEGRRIGFRPRP
jgi:hypothetical protein